MEHKYESDLTKKEKRQMEIEKLKSMNFMEKLDYIWTYYKLWFAGALAVVALIYLGFTMYQGMQKNEVVSVAILGANMDADQIAFSSYTPRSSDASISACAGFMRWFLFTRISKNRSFVLELGML